MKPLAKSAPEMGIELPEPPEAAPAPAPMELPEEHEEKLELASMQAFAPPPDAVGPEPEAPASALPEPIDLGAAQQVLRPGQAPSDGGEAVLRDALSKASQDVIEKVVWEVVPQLAETIIRENLDRLLKERQGT